VIGDVTGAAMQDEADEDTTFEDQEWGGLVGDVLDGRYRLDRRIASGGFGVVFAGTHLALESSIAVKVLRVALNVAEHHRAFVREQFIQEARMLSKLRHPHIVSVLDVGTLEAAGEETAYLVLEWCDGRDLGEEFEERRGLGGRSPAQAWTVLEPVLDALAHAHALGFVHRDVKPANVMLVDGPTGRIVKLIDFGIAKESDAGHAPSGHTATRSEVRALSLHHAAPEQVAGSRTGPWTDVHALGLLLSELLTDEEPYDAKDPAMAVIRSERPTPRKFGVDVGPWEDVLRRALAIAPGDRPATALALKEDLSRTLDAAQSAWLAHHTDPHGSTVPPSSSLSPRASLGSGIGIPPSVDGDIVRRHVAARREPGIDATLSTDTAILERVGAGAKPKSRAPAFLAVSALIVIGVLALALGKKQDDTRGVESRQAIATASAVAPLETAQDEAKAPTTTAPREASAPPAATAPPPQASASPTVHASSRVPTAPAAPRPSTRATTTQPSPTRVPSSTDSLY